MSFPLARLALGTVALANLERPQAFDLLDAAFDAGVSTFDTAHICGAGSSEEIVGDWLRRRPVRDQLKIITKGGASLDPCSRLNPKVLAADLRDSLGRMGLDHVELYLVHVDDTSAPVEDLVSELDRHVQKGTIDQYGLSNWSRTRFVRAELFAQKMNKALPAAASLHFSLARQFRPPWPASLSLTSPGSEEERDWYRSRSLPLLAWSPLAGGFFSGRFDRANLSTFTEYFDLRCIEAYCYEENFCRLGRARELAAAKSTTVSQVGLAYVMCQPLNIFPVLGCLTFTELQDALGARDLLLSTEELSWLWSGEG